MDIIKRMRATRYGLSSALVVLLGALAVLTAVSGRLSGAAQAQAQDGPPREFTLTAEPVRWQIQPGLIVDGWGYNGDTPGPTIRVTEGDRLRITLTNMLPVPTTIHWHGIDVPISQDGVPGLSQNAVEPGESFVYQFIATNPGTRWYHSHVDSNMQIQLGLFGALIVDPKTPAPVQYDREFTYILTEKALDVTPAVALGTADIRNREGGNGRGGFFMPDLFLMNGKAGSAIDGLTIAPGERVRVRLINAGNMVHTMHTHGHTFRIIATDGNPVPPLAQLLKDTVLIGPAERYDIEITGSNPGVWMFHCHINNHSANGMVTELRYDGAVPLAGGDHSLAHAPAASATPPPGAHDPAMHAAAATPASTPMASPRPSAVLAGTAGAPGEITTINMMDDRFVSSRIMVKLGTKVTWANVGNNLHDTSSYDGLWTSGSFPRGESFSYTFDKPGAYQYVCRQHFLQGMRGIVTVQE